MSTHCNINFFNRKMFDVSKHLDNRVPESERQKELSKKFKKNASDGT